MAKYWLNYQYVLLIMLLYISMQGWSQWFGPETYEGVRNNESRNATFDSAGQIKTLPITLTEQYWASIIYSDATNVWGESARITLYNNNLDWCITGYTWFNAEASSFYNVRFISVGKY